MELHWLRQSAGDVPAGEEWLSGNERDRLRALHIPKRRADWRLGRWTAKCAVSAYLKLGCEPEVLAAIEVRAASSGAPEVFLDEQAAPVTISLSHSSGTGLCVAGPSGVDVGCDLEIVVPRSSTFLTDYFTDDEQELVRRTPTARQDLVITLLWSAKESALKALRCGLRLDTREVNAVPMDFLEPNGNEWSRVCVRHSGGRTFHGWWGKWRNLIYTVAAGPEPLEPVALHPGWQVCTR